MFRRCLLQRSSQLSLAARSTIPRPLAATSPLLPRRIPSQHAQRWPQAIRWNSDNAAEKKNDEAAAASEEKTKEDTPAAPEAKDDKASEIAALKKELEIKDREAKEFKDKFQRSVADARNLLDRTERDKRAARDFALQKFSTDLIESIDNLERALEAVPETSLAENTDTYNKEVADLYNGFQMTVGILLKTLGKHGLEKTVPLGEPFDPNRHEAVFQLPMEGKEVGTVMNVTQCGYVLNGRTIRAAKVGIVKKP